MRKEVILNEVWWQEKQKWEMWKMGICAGNCSSLGTARMRSEDRIGIRLINMEKCSLSAGK